MWFAKIDLGIAEWVSQLANLYIDILQKYDFKIAEGTNIKDIFKIKMRDKSNPEFKDIPLKNYFEKKTSGDYTRSSIHGVKGETYDAVLIYVKSKTGKTLTPKFLMEGDLEDELMRTSEDTKRIVLDNSVSVEEITEIEVGVAILIITVMTMKMKSL